MPEGEAINAAVEGSVDEAVVRRLVQIAGMKLGAVYGKNGKSDLIKKLQGYNNAAQYSSWFILVDLDLDGECVPPLLPNWLPAPAPRMCFRVAVREVEAWMLADREHLSRFLRISQALIPKDPEGLQDPKQVLVNLAHRSRSKDIRADMAPRSGSGRSIGPAYSSRLIEFVTTQWRPEIAAHRCDSLRRAIDCLKRLATFD